MSFLDVMREKKKQWLQQYDGRVPVRTVPFVSLYNQLADQPFFIIAEWKKASPSKGDIPFQGTLKERIQSYEQGGATAISILTEPHYFKGSFEELQEAASSTTLPILCKDFIYFKEQIDVAKGYGASLILLIATGLSKKELVELYTYAHEIGLEVLVEIHEKEDIEKLEHIQPRLIGINNRNLKSLQISLQTTKDLLPIVRTQFPDSVVITESGILHEQDIREMQQIGVRGALIGEGLMISPEVKGRIKEWSLCVPK